ncbi:MAG: SIR2 family protein [Sphingomonadaceae bacterium]|nr:SIR2 family protein [Sphingomonadaceae bacterium]
MSAMFLFGAGASIDAGLSDAFTLTEDIYQRLNNGYQKDAAKIFGLVVAKVIAKKVRVGGSPFDRVNVEDVYDGIQRLASRETDILSDFVTGWDPGLALFRRRVDERDVERAFESLLNSVRADNFIGRGRVRLNLGAARPIQELLAKATDTSLGDNIGPVTDSLLRALVESLEHDSQRIDYFGRLIEIAKANAADLTTLNYDLIAESSAESLRLAYDYGLEKWNDEKIVSFGRTSASSVRIIKLHGSINWFANDDDIEVKQSEARLYRRIPNLVFGGAGNKLRIDGPFLQLRHEFQIRLLKTNTLVVVGYSFQDEHLNSIIRRWTNTRRKAKLIVVNPSPVGSFAGSIGLPYTKDDKGKIGNLTVDLIHIQTGAAAAVDALEQALAQGIELERPEANGFLPHVHFRRVA